MPEATLMTTKFRFEVEGLGGHRFRLARDGVADAWSSAWPGWSFVRLSRGRPHLPLLVKAPWHVLHAAHRAPKKLPWDRGS
jgi:hypothetical protein